MTNPFIDLTVDHDTSFNEVATIDESKRTNEENQKWKLELLHRQEKIIDLQSENTKLQFTIFKFEAQLNGVQAELDIANDKIEKIERQLEDRKQKISSKKKEPEIAPPKKPLPLKYFVDKFNKHVEEDGLRQYFKQFGNVKYVTLKELGMEKFTKPYSSAIVEFRELYCEDFLDIPHVIRKENIVVRIAVPNDELTPSNDWNEDEMGDLISPRKRSRKSSIDHYGSDSSSILDPLMRTHSILVRGPLYIQKHPEEKIRHYFSKYGIVLSVLPRGPPGRKLIFVKFDDYESAEDAINDSPHMISNIKYDALPAKDI